MTASSAAFAHTLQNWIGVGPLWVWSLTGALIIVFALALPFGGFAVYLERKISADIQDRIGPNRVGPLGLFQLFADIIKVLGKEDYIPKGGDRLLFNIAPMLVVGGAVGAFALLPFSRYLIGADLNVGIFFLLAITTLVAPGILLGSWGSLNKWSLLGGLRASAQMVSYEVPVALSLLPAILVSGTLQIGSIVDQQGWSVTAEHFANNHFWNAFHNPFAFFAMFLLFIGGLAETNRTPFDLPEAESELVSGFNTEFSGVRFVIYALGEYCDVFVACSLANALYLGGWHLPFINIEQLGVTLPIALVAIVQFTVFLTKTMLLVFVVMWLRWTLPRLRVDQLMGLCWKGLVPLALMNVLGTALWMWIFKGQSLLQLLVGAPG